jgi:hypothetical protein
MFERFFNWAFKTGVQLLEVDKEGKLLKRLIYDIRAEETPGRFLEKLSERITEYRTNRNINAKVEMDWGLFKKEGDEGTKTEIKWHGDNFYYMKSAVLSGFLEALAYSSKKENKGEKNE